MSNKEEILNKELDKKELKKVSGGCGKEGGENEECVYEHKRDIYCKNFDHRKLDFPNCACTVESGGMCEKNDACINLAINYQGMEECKMPFE